MSPEATDVLQPNLPPPQEPSLKPKRVWRRSPKTRPRMDYDPAVGAAVYRQLTGYWDASPGELRERIRQIQWLATQCRLPAQVWHVVDRMRARLRSGVHARSA
jgi:hypothetical protein